jgi:hypothetical protein
MTDETTDEITRDDLDDAHEHGKALGKLLGLATAVFEDAPDEFDLSQWKDHKNNETPIAYYRAPCAHGWQINEQPDGTLTLDDGADASDFALVIFADGFAVSGGAVSSTYSTTISDMLVQYVEDQVARLDQL